MSTLTYEEAARNRIPRKITTVEEHDRALEIIEDLMDLGGKRTENENVLLMTWADLVRIYDEENCPPLPADPVGMLKFLMEQRQWKAANLVPRVFGTSGYASQVLSGEREISKDAAIELGEIFGVPTDFFLARSKNHLDRVEKFKLDLLCELDRPHAPEYHDRLVVISKRLGMEERLAEKILVKMHKEELIHLRAYHPKGPMDGTPLEDWRSPASFFQSRFDGGAIRLRIMPAGIQYIAKHQSKSR